MFGTTAVLLVTSPDAVVPARSVADRVLADVDLACSRFRPDSELSRLNAADGEPLAISSYFRRPAGRGTARSEADRR